MTNIFEFVGIFMDVNSFCSQQPLHVENFLSDVLFKSLTLKTIHGRKIFSTWEKSEQLVYQNK